VRHTAGSPLPYSVGQWVSAERRFELDPLDRLPGSDLPTVPDPVSRVWIPALPAAFFADGRDGTAGVQVLDEILVGRPLGHPWRAAPRRAGDRTTPHQFWSRDRLESDHFRLLLRGSSVVRSGLPQSCSHESSTTSHGPGNLAYYTRGTAACEFRFLLLIAFLVGCPDRPGCPDDWWWPTRGAPSAPDMPRTHAPL